MPLMSDEEVFGTTQIPTLASQPQRLMTDEEVFGTPSPGQKRLMTDEEVFGKPAAAAEGPGLLGYGKEFLKQVGVGGIETAVPMYLRGVGQDQPLPGEMESIVAPTVPEGTMPPPPQYPARPLSETPSYQTAEQISKAIGSDQPSPILHPVVTDIARGLGSVASSIVTSPIGGPIMASRGEAAQTAIAKGATPEQQAKAQNLGEIAGLTDFADLLLVSAGSSGKALGLMARVGKSILQKALIEGGQEGLQQMIQNLISKGVYKPDQDIFQDVPYNAFIGAVVGGAVGSVTPQPAAVEQGGLTQEAALRGFSGEAPQGPGAPPQTGPAQPPPPQQLSLPLGGTAVEPQLPLGTPPEAVVPPEVIPPAGAEPKLDIPSDIKPEIEDFIDKAAIKSSALTLPTKPIDLDKLLEERSEQKIRSTPGANISRMAMLLDSKLYGDRAEMAPVTVKEILQNSFDAIKGMLKHGIKDGNIDIVTDSIDRTITVVDDGTGMTPEVLGKQFLEIAGTSKESERASGGLGIAKMMFLFGNKNLNVITMRNGKVSELATTGEQLFEALGNPKKAPDINVREPTPQDLKMFPKGRGTVIKVQIPETYKDSSTGEVKPIDFNSVDSARGIPVLRNSPLFDDIGVTFNGETLPIGRNFPMSEYTPFVGDVKFDWGTASIYVSQQEHTYDKWGRNNGHVLSNGLWQFSFPVTKKPDDPYGDKIQRTFYIDVSPKVKPEHQGYPFDLNRQQFSAKAKEDFQKIFNFISKTYQLEDYQLETENFGEMRYLKFDMAGRAVTYTPPVIIKPEKPQITPVRKIRPGDKVSIKNGKMVVNGKAIPELTAKEIEEFDVDVAALKVPQGQIDSGEVILHDNTAVDPTGAPLTISSPRVSLTQYAVTKFGNRFYEYSFLMGNALRQLRDVVATLEDSLGRNYTELVNQAVGISYDKSYRGVSIRVPFSGSFLNPAVPAFPRDPLHAAVGMVTTMVHEFAHLHHRSEKDLGPVIQDLFTKLDTHPTFDFQAFKQKVINIVNTYFDVMTDLNGVFEDGNVESRGIRFKTGTDQARDGSSFGNAEPGSLEQSRKGSELSEWVNLGETSSGQRAGRDDGGARTQEIGGAAAADFGISANQRVLDAETGPGVPAAPRHPATQVVLTALKQAVGPNPPQRVARGLAQAAAHADRIHWLYEYAAGILELAKVNPRFTPLLTYVQHAQLMHREESQIQDVGVSLNKQWRSLGAQSENVVEFLDEITNMTYRTPQEIRQGITRNPTPAEVNAIAQRVGLDAKGAAFAGKIRKFFSDFLDLMATNAKEAAMKTITDPVALGVELNKINAGVAKLKSKPYFPFMRYGKYFVTVKNAAGDVVDFQLFERKGILSAERRQQRFKREMVQRYGAALVTDGVLPENSMPMVGMPKVLLDRVKTELNLTKRQADALEQLSFEMSPTLSFKHRFQHKNYVKGYSKDFARSFARYVFYGARFYARTKYAPLMRDDIAAADTVGGNKADRIRNYMQDHLDNTVLDAKGDFGWVKGLAFFWHLGYSPAAATTNLTQLPMFTYPYLASKFGTLAGVSDVKAMYAMTKAMAQVNKTFRKKGHYQNHTAFEMRAIGYGLKTGVISETQAAELAALGNQTNLLHGSAGNTLERGMIGFQQGAAILFETAEQVNRRVTFRAALDLAQQYPNAPIVKEAVDRRQVEFTDLTTTQGFTPAEAKAIITALHTVEETQVVYGRYARPRLFRGRLSGSVLIFERYMQAMIMQMVHNKGAAARTLLLMALLGGLGGLPGYEDLKGIIKAAYKQLGFGSDPELDLRRWIIQQFDGSIEPDIVLHGLSRRGFGIPAILDALGSLWTGNPGRGLEGARPGVNVSAPVLDFSKSVGMGQILPIQVGKLAEPQEKQDKVIAEQAQRAAGAGWSIFFNMYRSIMDQKMELSDPKRWERMLPRQMGAMSKAYRAYEEGRERTRSAGPSGASTVVNYDVRDTEQLMEVIAKGMGYNVTREAIKWDYIMAKKESEDHIKMEREGIVNQFFEAWSGKDQREIAEVKKAIDRYNAEVKGTEFRGYAITNDSLKASVEGKQRERIGQEMGMPTQKRQVPLVRAIQELYPEAKGVIDVRKAP